MSIGGAGVLKSRIQTSVQGNTGLKSQNATPKLGHHLWLSKATPPPLFQSIGEIRRPAEHAEHHMVRVQCYIKQVQLQSAQTVR